MDLSANGSGCRAKAGFKRFKGTNFFDLVDLPQFFENGNIPQE